VSQATAEPVFETTVTALQEKKKLRRHFRRFDMFFYLICTVVTLDTIGSVASNGAQGFTWLIFRAIFFFLPYGLSVAEMGSAFPEEGGPYIWSRLAFGRPVAAVNSVIYWISNPIWVGGSLTIVSFAAIEEFFGNVSGAWKYVYAVVFIWFVILAAIVSLQYGKWVPTVGAWARGALITIFVITVAIYAGKHGVHGFGGHAFLPTYAIFIAVVPVLLFNYAGLEVPSAAGEEMVNPVRDVPKAVGWSAITTFFAYGIPILAILIVLPQSQVSGLTGFLLSVKAVFTVYGGSVSASGVTLTGAGLVLAPSVLFAIDFVIAKHLLRGLSTLAVMTAKMTLGSALLVAFSGLTGHLAGLARLSAYQVEFVLLTGLILLAFTCFTFLAIRHAMVSAVMAIGMGSPIVTTAIQLSVNQHFNIARAEVAGLAVTLLTVSFILVLGIRTEAPARRWVAVARA